MKKSKRAPFLGAIKLKWCDLCNIPILDKKTCGLCGEQSRSVNIAPPGDVRPAFNKDINRIALIVDEKFGKGSAEALGLVKGRIVLLNETSYEDLLDEVIIDGHIVGALRYNLFLEDWDFSPRMIGAKRIFENSNKKKKTLTVDEGAVSFIIAGYNVLAPGVIRIDESLRKGEVAIALSPEGEVLSIGNMRIDAKHLKNSTKGVVLKPKYYLKKFDSNFDYAQKTTQPSWKKAVEANTKTIEEYEKRAITAINDARRLHSDLPLSVSFSGGKDSLVCLQLARKIPNLDFRILFVNTSLEFQETIDYVEELISKFNLRDNYCRKDISEEKFWSSTDNFGPPGKDYRYCCKILKIGPINDLIEECVGEKTLSIVGQRGYESIARFASKTLWSNPWIPNQVNFTPIQKWTALHVWMYIFKEELEYNPLYEEGLSRIGCWLCPASNQATFEIIKELKPVLWKSWMDFLEKWQKENSLPKEWITWGLWRWKRLPKKIKDLAVETGVNLDYEKKVEKTIGDWSLNFELFEGFTTCQTGEVIIEGTFNSLLNLTRLLQFWQIFTETDYDEELGILRGIDKKGTTISISADGAITAKGKNPFTVKKLLKKLVLEVFRSEECTGCQTCLVHCASEAININPTLNQTEINVSLCTQCMECHNRCPVIKFGHREIDELFSKENNS